LTEPSSGTKRMHPEGETAHA